MRSAICKHSHRNPRLHLLPLPPPLLVNIPPAFTERQGDFPRIYLFLRTHLLLLPSYPNLAQPSASSVTTRLHRPFRTSVQPTSAPSSSSITVGKRQTPDHPAGRRGESDRRIPVRLVGHKRTKFRAKSGTQRRRFLTNFCGPQLLSIGHRHRKGKDRHRHTRGKDRHRHTKGKDRHHRIQSWDQSLRNLLINRRDPDNSQCQSSPSSEMPKRRPTSTRARRRPTK